MGDGQGNATYVTFPKLKTKFDQYSINSGERLLTARDTVNELDGASLALPIHVALGVHKYACSKVKSIQNMFGQLQAEKQFKNIRKSIKLCHFLFSAVFA